jgi:hypothetical protein
MQAIARAALRCAVTSACFALRAGINAARSTLCARSEDKLGLGFFASLGEIWRTRGDAATALAAFCAGRG